MPSFDLTTKSVESMRPDKTRRKEMADARCLGLYLVVEPSGTKSWALRYRTDANKGKQAKLTLGRFDPLDTKNPNPQIGQAHGVGSARVLATRLWNENMSGIDIRAKYLEKNEQRRLAADAAAKTTFPICARDYVEDLRDRRKNRTWWRVALALGLDYDRGAATEPQIIRRSLCDLWKDKPVGDFVRRDLIEKIDEAHRSGIPGRSVATRGTSIHRERELSNALKGLFRWLATKDRIAVNPASGLEAGDVGEARDRVLTDAELKRVWEAADGCEGTFGTIVRLLLLTGQRRSEVAGMRWSELDVGARADIPSLWRIPGERTKNGEAHVVPLSRLAVAEIMENIQPPLRDVDLVFVGRTGRTPFSGFGKATAHLYALAKLKTPWTLHDLRRTMVTRMCGEELGIEPHIVEAVVNHKSGHKAGVAGIYNRATYEPKKRTALDAWSKYVEALVSGEAPTTVEFSKRRKRAS